MTCPLPLCGQLPTVSEPPNLAKVPLTLTLQYGGPSRVEELTETLQGPGPQGGGC